MPRFHPRSLVFPWRLLLAAAFVCLVTCGCVNKDVTREHYEDITKGMTYEQVEKILGPPSARVTGSGSRAYSIAGDYRMDRYGKVTINAGAISWTENQQTITLRFAGGRVVEKSQSGL